MSPSSIRPFTEADIAETAQLHRRVFELPEWEGQEREYRQYFTETFLRSGPARSDPPSLVAVDNEGRIAGFIGVVTRRMWAGGVRIRAAVSSQFIVRANSRSSLAAIELMKRFLAGPQDLSFTDEAGERSARIWERLGGVRSPIHSLHWVIPLRPARLLLQRLKDHGRWLLPPLLRPLACVNDAVMSRVARSARPPAAQLHQQLEGPEFFIQSWRELRKDWPLVPDYDLRDIERLISIARSRRRFGEFRPISLRQDDGRLAGWCMYYANPNQLSEVIQIAARTGMEAEVMSHLIEQAYQEGALGLVGRMDPPFQHSIAKSITALSARQCLMLVHSRNPDLVRLITGGSAFLSRLEGEWCLRFR